MGGRRAEHEPGDPQDGLDAVTHGFGSSFRDWAAEQNHTPHAVMEAALARTIKNKAEAPGNADGFELIARPPRAAYGRFHRVKDSRSVLAILNPESAAPAD